MKFYSIYFFIALNTDIEINYVTEISFIKVDGKDLRKRKKEINMDLRVGQWRV